jgi:beta-lactamase class A
MLRAASLAIFVSGTMLFSGGLMLADVRAIESQSADNAVTVTGPPAADTPPPTPAATSSPEATSSTEAISGEQATPSIEAKPNPKAVSIRDGGPILDYPSQTQAAPVAPPVPVHASFDPLAQAINAIIAGSGASVGVSLIELGGPVPSAWSDSGSVVVDAASTYKLVALMEEASLIASGQLDPNGLVCFEDADWEDGWFADYSEGSCYSRIELAQRAGHYSDNTAGHMLVRDLGGSARLNAFASSLGARSSSFFDSNTTTADDLSLLLVAEAQAKVGGTAAQSWLYPLLTNTRYEAGIPAGSPAAIVIHKTGELDAVTDDAGLVTGGKNGPYALSVTTDGLGDAGWAVIAQISAAIWQYETAR